MKIGVFTVGQAPMPGLKSDLEELFGTGYEIIEAGALDDMSKDQIEELYPKPNERLTVTRLRGGEDVLLASDRLYPLAQHAIDKLEKQGAEIIFPACGGNLPEYDHSVQYVQTYGALKLLVDSMLPKGKLALLIPNAKQREKNESWYAHPDRELFIEGAAPSSDDEVREAARRLAIHDPDLLVLTCFANDMRQRELVRDLVSCPVLVSRAVVVDAVRGMLQKAPLAEVDT